MERKDFDREHPQAKDREHPDAKTDKSGMTEGHDASSQESSSSLESMMSDMGYTDEGAAKDFERQGDFTDFSRKSQDADFAHEPPGREFTRRGGAERQQGGSTGPKPYTGSQSGPSTGSSGHLSSAEYATGSKSSSYGGGSSGFGSGRYVGMGKIAKQMGMDVHQLRSCAQSQGIVPDKHQHSCDMFSQDKANQIMQACGTGQYSG